MNNPAIADAESRNRRSLRLPEFDYSLAGAYFVTICTQDRSCLLGEIVNAEMQLNEAGMMVTRWWGELNRKFPDISTDEFVVMPNHVHGIIVIVGAALCGRPDPSAQDGRPQRGAPTLGSIIGWFKTMSTNEYIRGVKQRGWPSFNRRLWQRNYHEHIIRNEHDLHDTRQYIRDNSLQWALDDENPTNERNTP